MGAWPPQYTPPTLVTIQLAWCYVHGLVGIPSRLFWRVYLVYKCKACTVTHMNMQCMISDESRFITQQIQKCAVRGCLRKQRKNKYIHKWIPIPKIVITKIIAEGKKWNKSRGIREFMVICKRKKKILLPPPTLSKKYETFANQFVNTPSRNYCHQSQL